MQMQAQLQPIGLIKVDIRWAMNIILLYCGLIPHSSSSHNSMACTVKDSLGIKAVMFQVGGCLKAGPILNRNDGETWKEEHIFTALHSQIISFSPSPFPISLYLYTTLSSDYSTSISRRIYHGGFQHSCQTICRLLLQHL